MQFVFVYHMTPATAPLDKLSDSPAVIGTDDLKMCKLTRTINLLQELNSSLFFLNDGFTLFCVTPVQAVHKYKDVPGCRVGGLGSKSLMGQRVGSAHRSECKHYTTRTLMYEHPECGWVLIRKYGRAPSMWAPIITLS